MAQITRQILARDFKTPLNGGSDTNDVDMPNIAGRGHGILVVPGGADDVLPGGFPVVLRFHFGDTQEEVPLQAPRALYFPKPFDRVDLLKADQERGYTVYVATDPGVMIGPGRSTRKAVNWVPAGTEVPSGVAESWTDGLQMNAGVGAIIGRFDGGDETTVITEYIRYADGSWEESGNTYGSGESFTLAVDHPGAAYKWRHTAGAAATYLIDVVAEVG